jgi:hypothetical protein
MHVWTPGMGDAKRLLITLFQCVFVCVCVCVCAIIWVAGIARRSRPYLVPGTAAVFGPRATGWKAGMEVLGVGI